MTSLPPDLAAALGEAKDRERRILDLQAAIAAADGPDEREAAQARLIAYLDKNDEQDRTDLARLGYFRDPHITGDGVRHSTLQAALDHAVVVEVVTGHIVAVERAR